MTVRVKSGSVTATISGMEGATVRRIVARAMGGALEVMESEAETLAAEARREWYGPNGVERETGKSGDIQVVTTIDLNRSEVRVSIGSTDDRKAGKTNKPVPVFVHQPWGTSLTPRRVSQPEWGAWKGRGLPVLPPPPQSFSRRDGGERSAASVKAEVASRKFWERAEKDDGLVPDWYVLEANDAPATAKPQSFLLQRLVKKPAKELAKKMAPEIARSIAQAVNRGE